MNMDLDPIRPSDASMPIPKRRRFRPSSTSLASSDTSAHESDSTFSKIRDVDEERPFWFSDGDLVLALDDTKFRVHRARLACSDIFADMLALPQPPDAECVDGAPVVHLSDSAQDWLTVLEWMYDPTGFARKPQAQVFELLAGTLRIAAKYDIQELGDWAVLNLCKIWPEDLGEMTSAAFPRAADAIALTRSLDVPKLNRILPTAFYALSIQRFGHAAYGSHTQRVLSSSDLAHLLSARDALHALALQLALDPLGPVLTASEGARPASANPWGFCAGCADTLAAAWRARLRERPEDVGGPTGLWLAREFACLTRRSPEAIHASVCEHCWFANESLAWERLREFKRRVPKLFDL